MDFQTAYEELIEYHVKRRTGQNAARIRGGLQHAGKLFLENVWWPIFHNFDALHPEYEIRDYKDGNRYLDFAYLPGKYKVAIEIDGFGPHWKDISQEQFSDHLVRQNHLMIDMWKVLRFAYIRVEHSPRTCQQMIQQLIGSVANDPLHHFRTLEFLDRETVRLALISKRPITPADVSEKMGSGRHASIRRLKKLVESGWLVPASGTNRIRSYQVHPTYADLQLW